MGPGVDKLFLEVAGRPVVAHTWQRFNDAACIDEVILVVRDGMQSVFAELAQQFQFSRIDARMLARFVPKPAEEKNRPHHPQAAKQKEHPSPRHDGKHPHHQQRRERSTPARAQPHDALGAHPLG